MPLRNVLPLVNLSGKEVIFKILAVGTANKKQTLPTKST